MIKVRNLDSFDATVQGWFSAVREAAAEVAVGLAKQAFNQLLYTSPQYRGDFVANWRVSVGQPDTTFVENAVAPSAGTYTGRLSFEPFEKGSPQAVTYAKAMAKGKLDGFRLGQRIFISNSAAHDEPYAWKIEDGLIKLRPVNAGAAHVVARALAFVHGRNRYINTPGHLAALRRFGA